MKANISVIVPIQNSAEIPLECLKSIFSQTLRPAEVIVIFNGLPVADQKFAERMIKSEAPIFIKLKFLNEKLPSGSNLFSQSIKGVEIATKKYLWVADPKSRYDTDFLKSVMAKTSSTPVAHDFSVGNDIKTPSGIVFKNEDYLKSIFADSAKYNFVYGWFACRKISDLGGAFYDGGDLVSLVNSSKLSELNAEYREICSFQAELARELNLKNPQQQQRAYLRKIGFTENPKNTGKLKKIAWFIPDFGAGSGGHRTIFTNAELLIARGYQCDLYVNSARPEYPIDTLKRIKEDYGIDFSGDIYSGFDLAKDYDMIFATSWDTAKPVRDTSVPQKLYFIQDYEPWFFPMGDEFVAASESYEYGFKGIAIGKWLAQKISEEHHAETKFFNFCADLNTYHPLSNIKTEKAICAIFQPDKSRRCPKLVLAALRAFQKVHPEIKIYLYGSPKQDVPGLKATHLGTISVEKCNELYNKCLAGLCISLTNPSRIPFEMMAAGLPVVDLRRENNLCDFPDAGCSLAESNAESIAEKLSEIVENDKVRTKMSKAGQSFMKGYPLEKGYNQFVDFVDSL